jgi:hypothetical protein
VSAVIAPGIGSPPTLRRAQTQQELQRFADELDTWADARAAADQKGQHKTQLAAIVTEVQGALDMVRERLAALGSGTAAGELYTRLARIDRQIIWIRYAWDFFRSRFDQRDDARLGPALRAADEVSWSCFKPAFQGKQSRPPAPLPYIDLDYSPSTLLSTHAHRLDRLDRVDNQALKNFFAQLPVPLLGLPPTIVTSPWLLALVGHEMGHAVMSFVDGAGKDAFAERIAAAVTAAGGAEADRMRWSAWAPELFADWYGLLMMGAAGAWSLGQLEFGEPAQMSANRERYPPALVRLLVLARMAGQIGFRDAASIFAPFGIEAAQLTATAANGIDGKIAEEIAKLVRRDAQGPAAALATQVEFRANDFDADAGGALAPVDKWAQVLRGKIDRPVENELRSARLVTAGAVKAALGIQDEKIDETKEDQLAARDSKLDALRATSLERIAASSEKGTRAAPLQPKPLHQPLARVLLDLPDDELFGHAERAP